MLGWAVESTRPSQQKQYVWSDWKKLANTVAVARTGNVGVGVRRANAGVDAKLVNVSVDARLVNADVGDSDAIVDPRVWRSTGADEWLMRT